MAPALTPLTAAFPEPASVEVQARGEDPQPPGALAPAPALGTVPQMRVQHRLADPWRRPLVVDAGGYSGTKLTAVHPAMVSGVCAAHSTGGRRA